MDSSTVLPYGVRKSTEADLPRLLELFAGARERMRANGNPNQWGNDWPPEDLIRSDIESGHSYVLLEKEQIVGTFSFFPGVDPTYLQIDAGAWLNDRPYAAVHRVASDGVHHGIVKAVAAFAKGKADNLRMDTHAQNIPMQSALLGCGFLYCGIIYVRDCSPRNAYQLDLRRDTDSDREVRGVLLDHAAKYPKMQPVDAVKLLYQNEFGGGHLIHDVNRALSFLKAEIEAVSDTPRKMCLSEPIGNGMLRIDLHAFRDNSVLLGEAFVRSANHHTGSLNRFVEKLSVLSHLTEAGKMPFSSASLETYLQAYRRAGYPMISHSEEYRQAYSPAYRIVRADDFYRMMATCTSSVPPHH